MHTDYDNIDEILLSEMENAGFISETKTKLYSSRKKLHESSNQHLLESESTSHEYHTMGQVVPWDQFKRVYMDYEHYPKVEDVMSALGLPKALFAGQQDQSYTRKLNTIRQWFVKNNLDGSLVDVHFNDRRKAYYLSDRIPEASTERVKPGRRGEVKKSTKVVTYMNDQEVVPGEFYSDISRIPRRRWGGWVRFWERQVSRIKNPKSMIGRVWSKTFLMGYQFSPRVVIEIWYNSATSDFSLYDYNGGELGRPAKTLQEALRLFVTFLLREYESDKSVFNGGTQELSKSYMSALSHGVRQDAIEAERESSLAAKEKRNGGKVQNSITRAVSQQMNKNVQTHTEVDAKRKEIAKKGWDSTTGSSIKDKVAAGVKKIRGERGHEWDDPAEMQKKYNQEREALIKKSKEKQEKASKKAREEYSNRTTFNPYSTPTGRGEETSFDPVSHPDYSKLMRQYNDALSRYETEKEELDQMERERKTIDPSSNEIPAVTKDDIDKQRELVKKQNEIKKSSLEMLKDAGLDVPTFIPKKTGNGGKGGGNKPTNEGIEEDLASFGFDAAAVELDNKAISRRKTAEQSGFTTTAIKTATMGEMLSVYNNTRVRHSNAGVIRRWLDRSRMMRGRKAKIERPREEATEFDRLRMAFLGINYRADFVIGFSLKDAINIEIWYVTEPSDSNAQNTVSSFYVYDVTAEQVVRANLPYYRNALQVVMAKIGVTE